MSFDWEPIAALAGVAAGALALIGLILQNRWVRGQIQSSRDIALFGSNVDGPISRAIEGLDSFEVVISDFARKNEYASPAAVQSSGSSVLRRVNTATNRAAKYDKSREAEWDSLTTDAIEELLDEVSASTRLICSAALKREVDILRQSLVELLAVASHAHRDS